MSYLRIFLIFWSIFSISYSFASESDEGLDTPLLPVSGHAASQLLPVSGHAASQEPSTPFGEQRIVFEHCMNGLLSAAIIAWATAPLNNIDPNKDPALATLATLALYSKILYPLVKTAHDSRHPLLSLLANSALVLPALTGDMSGDPFKNSTLIRGSSV